MLDSKLCSIYRQQDYMDCHHISTDPQIYKKKEGSDG